MGPLHRGLFSDGEIRMKIKCDFCSRAVEDSLLQIVEQDGEILYACPECFLATQGESSPEEQP